MSELLNITALKAWYDPAKQVLKGLDLDEIEEVYKKSVNAALEDIFLTLRSKCRTTTSSKTTRCSRYWTSWMSLNALRIREINFESAKSFPSRTSYIWIWVLTCRHLMSKPRYNRAGMQDVCTISDHDYLLVLLLHLGQMILQQGTIAGIVLFNSIT